MRSCPVVALHEIAAYVLLSQRCCHVTHRRHPLRFQAAKQPLHGGVVVAVSPPAHALRHPIAPEPLTETTAAILATLVAVKQDTLRSATHLVSPVERLDDQVGIGLGRHRPAHHSTAVQVQDDGQVAPSTLRPDIGDIATPDPVWRGNGELLVEDIGNIRALNRGLLVRMRAWLLADQSLFPHQASDLEAPNLGAFVLEHGNDTATTGRATALAEQLVDAAAQSHSAHIDTPSSGQVRVITRSGQLEH